MLDRDRDAAAVENVVRQSREALPDGGKIRMRTRSPITPKVPAHPGAAVESGDECGRVRNDCAIAQPAPGRDAARHRVPRARAAAIALSHGEGEDADVRLFAAYSLMTARRQSSLDRTCIGVAPRRAVVVMLVMLAATRAAAAGATTDEDPVAIPPPPPGFDARRPLDPGDYRRKNEGGYVTGLPLVNYDSNFGFGGGARAYYFWNGTRADPRFAYTPYLDRVFIQAFATTGGLQFHWLDYDVPSISGTPFRFRSQLIFVRNTDEHYYGVGSRSLDPLSFPGSAQTFTRYADYQKALDGVTPQGTTWHRYDQYLLARPLWLASIERTLFHGLIRPMIGVGFNYYAITRYGGGADASTRLDEDCAPPARIVGCAGGWDNFLRAGLSFDTRDFEPDPKRGVFADLALDHGTRLLGSRYTWTRGMLAARGYVRVLPWSDNLVLAARATFQLQSTTTPFFGMKLIPYIEDPRDGLGGLRTMRGYKQDRFVGPVMLLGNVELRWTFVRFVWWRQKIGLIAVPFFDVGTVADRLSGVRRNGWRPDTGGALRISWNLATIVTLEYGRSSEDEGVFANFNHTF